MPKRRQVPIRLRRFASDDIPHKIRWAHDPRINHFLHHPLPLTEARVARWLDTMEAEDRHDLVIETSAGRPIGTVGLENVDRQHRCGEYYICVGEPEFFGTSVATDAAHALLAYAFLQLGLNKVFGRAETGNIPSVNLMIRLGFQPEGVLRQAYLRDDGPRDAVRLGLLAGEYLTTTHCRHHANTQRSELRQLYDAVILARCHGEPATETLGIPQHGERRDALESQPELAPLLALAERALHGTWSGSCGAVAIEPHPAPSWLGLLCCLEDLGKLEDRSVGAQGRGVTLETQIDSLIDLGARVDDAHRHEELTPALWQAVGRTLGQRLTTLASPVLSR